MSTKDIWHFARPLLAKQYLGEFDLGLISARALFAKRRMGKSTFLEQDLIRAAKQAGYMTPYLNLWTATTRRPRRSMCRACGRDAQRLAQGTQRPEGCEVCQDLGGLERDLGAHAAAFSALIRGRVSLAGMSRTDCYVGHTHSIGFAHAALVGLLTPVFESLVAQFAPVGEGETVTVDAGIDVVYSFSLDHNSSCFAYCLGSRSSDEARPVSASHRLYPVHHARTAS
jgi:hypothetical protein